MNNLEHEITELEQRLHVLDAERATVAQALATLRQRRQEQIESFAQRVAEATVTHQSSPSLFLIESLDKIDWRLSTLIGL